MKSTRRWQQLLLNSLAIILGNALYSLAVALFLEPAGLITGALWALDVNGLITIQGVVGV